MALVAAHAELGDQSANGLEDRIEGFSVAREDHPGSKRARALSIEGVERAVDKLAGVGLAAPGALDGLGNMSSHALGNVLSKCSLKPGRRAEMMDEVGVGAADSSRYSLQGNGLRPFFQKQPASSTHGGGSAFLRAKAFRPY